MGEFEGDVGVRVRRHATWNMERHLVTRRDPGMETCLFSSLLVVGSGLVTDVSLPESAHAQISIK